MWPSKTARGTFREWCKYVCAKIGKYLSENGDLKDINHVKAQIPNLTFKTTYIKKPREEKQRENTEAEVISIPHDTRGRPPILHELESKSEFPFFRA